MGKGIVLFWALWFYACYARADVPTIDGLTENEVTELHNDFSANFIFSSASPVETLGKYWGIEAGAVAGVTPSPAIDKIHLRLKNNSSYEGMETQTNFAIPHAAALARISLGRILFEGTLFPKKTFSDLTFYKMGGALSYIFKPVKLLKIFSEKNLYTFGLRFYHSTSEISYNQTLNNYSTGNEDVTSNINYQTSISGVDLTVAFDQLWSILTLYAGFGYAKSEGHIGSSLGTLFEETGKHANASEVQLENSGRHIFSGLQFNLLILRLSLEASQYLGRGKMAIKMAIKI